jgi:serine phosphatase RsbU (regulator of sigma subunit)
VVETKNADGKLFGFDRLLSACCADAASPRAALAALSAQMVEFRGGAPVLDDVSALALRVNPHTTYMSTAMK